MHSCTHLQMHARKYKKWRAYGLSIWWRLIMTSCPTREWIKPDHSSIPLWNDIRGRENENRDGNRHRWKVRGRVIEGVREWLNRLVSDVGDWEWMTAQNNTEDGNGSGWWTEMMPTKSEGSLHFHPYSSIHPSMQPFAWHQWHHRKKRGSKLKQGHLTVSNY